MDENRTENSNYEPNFVMKDPDDTQNSSPFSADADRGAGGGRGTDAVDDPGAAGFGATVSAPNPGSSTGAGSDANTAYGAGAGSGASGFSTSDFDPNTGSGASSGFDTGAGFGTSGSAPNPGSGATGFGPNTGGGMSGFDTGAYAGASGSNGISYTGSYTDPRDNFRSSGSQNSTDWNGSYGNDAYSGGNYYGCSDNVYQGGGQTYETPNGFENNGAFTDPYDAAAGDSASWDNQNGLGKVHKKHRKAPRKPSPQVTFTRRSLAWVIVLCMVVSGGVGFGGAAAANAIWGNKTAASTKTGSVKTTGYTLEDATGSNKTVQEITEEARPSVVEIQTESVASDSWMQQYVTQGAGSGVIITEDGYIVTNNHVIEGASKITVTTSDQKEYEAELVGTDSITDVAVLKIKASGLTPVTYGNSDQLAVGDLAVAIGNPLGELGGTVTAGIISALDRELAIDGKTMTLLQTDSSINPGNSGGGLFNGDGQLIGIVVAKSSGSDVEGLGFAIPINKAADVAQQIMDKGYVSGQPSTGMSYTESSGQSSSMDRLFNNGQSATYVYIAAVEGENAQKAGFQKGDMVYAVDGTEITSFNTLSSIVTSHSVGDKLKYTVIRNGQQMDITLTLEEKTS